MWRDVSRPIAIGGGGTLSDTKKRREGKNLRMKTKSEKKKGKKKKKSDYQNVEYKRSMIQKVVDTKGR